MSGLDGLKVKIFADGADLAGISELYKNPLIKGFTTNPTLMKQAGVTDYREFARTLLRAVPDRPISFEVVADDFEEMEWQALEIASWGGSVVVKIPVTNTRGENSGLLIRRLAGAGVRLNITAIMTLDQVRNVAECLGEGPPSYISVFAGRVADTGRDPVPHMAEAVQILRKYPLDRTYLGQSSRIVEHLPGGCDWLPRNHGYTRCIEETQTGGEGSGRVLAGNGRDVLH